MTLRKHHVLAATPETTQWGWLDPKEKPKLTVNSGDTISNETMMHSMDAVQPGKHIDDVVKLRLAQDLNQDLNQPRNLVV